MKRNILALSILITLLAGKTIAQPYVDVLNLSCQTFSSNYKDTTRWKNHTDDYHFNLFVPKEFKNGNTLIVRFNGEFLNSTFSPDYSYTRQLSSVAIPLGFQFVSSNKKWKTLFMAIPKVASDFNNPIDSHDYQMGGIFLENFIANDKLKIKAGLYYNYEAFGNYFIPLLGLDWQATPRINLYGTLPSMFKIEFNVIKNKLYTGINFKSFTRSFRLSKQEGYDYVRYDEIVLKCFIDYFIYKKIVLFAEAGYSLGKNPLQYAYNTNDKVYYNPIFTLTNPYPLFNFGIAYRLRFDLQK